MLLPNLCALFHVILDKKRETTSAVQDVNSARCLQSVWTLIDSKTYYRELSGLSIMRTYFIKKRHVTRISET